MAEPLVSFEDRVLGSLLERGAKLWPDKELVRWETGSVTYSGLRERVAGMGGSLAALGIDKGDRVAIMAGNRIEFLEVWLGCNWLGAIAVPINVSARGDALRHALANSAPRLLVCERALLEHVGAITELPDSLERAWVLADADADADADGDGATLEAGLPRRVAVDDHPGPGEPVERAELSPGDTSAILYTSGTTGPAKGVICPHAHLIGFGATTARNLGVREDDVLYTVLPMFHVNALNTFAQALLVGATYAFGKRFSASRFWDQIRAHEATVTYLLGAMVHILLGRDEGPGDADSTLRVALSPAPPEDVEAFRERFGVQLIEGYGSTETSMIMCNRRGAEIRSGAMGWVVDGFEVKVVDGSDYPVPDGTPGEMVVRSREPFSLAAGYFGMPEKTVEAWRNLWFHTGDRVVREPDGVFRFLDRMNDAIRRRGENISSHEVEQAVLTHPDIESCAAVPVPSELGEDDVMVFAIPRAGSTPSPTTLVEHCEPRLAYFAIPRYIELVDELPLTQNGKVRKTALRERGVSERTWDRERQR